MWAFWLGVLIGGVALIVWGAEMFAEHLAEAATRLGVGVFALALLLAGAEPEELATVVAAALRDSPGIAFGDIAGANVAAVLAALGLGAVVTPLPFTRRVFAYALVGLPVGAAAVALLWDGGLARTEGAMLVALYVAYVAVVWWFERAPPALGEVEGLEEWREKLTQPGRRDSAGRVGLELVIVLAGLMAMAAGAWLLVEGVRRITDAEGPQTVLGLTIIGFATAFELVVLCVAAARRGASDVVVASVVGSFAYNATMSLGTGALVRPIALVDARPLRLPLVLMLVAFAAVIAAAVPGRRLGRPAGVALLVGYLAFVLVVSWRGLREPW